MQRTKKRPYQFHSEQFIEGQEFKDAIDHILPMTGLTEVENSVEHATKHPRWQQPNEVTRGVSARNRLLDMLAQSIRILAEELRKLPPV